MRRKELFYYTLFKKNNDERIMLTKRADQPRSYFAVGMMPHTRALDIALGNHALCTLSQPTDYSLISE